MSMKRPVFDVYLLGNEDPIRVEIAHADMLVSEQAAPRYGLAQSVEEAPMTWSTLWIWHALARTGDYTGAWQKFKLEDCAGFQEPADVPGGAPVDPTQPAAPTASP